MIRFRFPGHNKSKDLSAFRSAHKQPEKASVEQLITLKPHLKVIICSVSHCRFLAIVIKAVAKFGFLWLRTNK